MRSESDKKYQGKQYICEPVLTRNTLGLMWKCKNLESRHLTGSSHPMGTKINPRYGIPKETLILYLRIKKTDIKISMKKSFYRYLLYNRDHFRLNVIIGPHGT